DLVLARLVLLLAAHAVLALDRLLLGRLLVGHARRRAELAVGRHVVAREAALRRRTDRGRCGARDGGESEHGDESEPGRTHRILLGHTRWTRRVGLGGKGRRAGGIPLSAAAG